MNDFHHSGNPVAQMQPAGAGSESAAHGRGQPDFLAARLAELEAANERLLQLVGELLVANQQLREQRTTA